MKGSAHHKLEPRLTNGGQVVGVAAPTFRVCFQLTPREWSLLRPLCETVIGDTAVDGSLY